MPKKDKAARQPLRTLASGLGVASLLAVPLVSELRFRRPEQPLTDAWQHLPIEPRRATLLGISFRSPQVDALGLDARATLQTLLTYPFQLIRLGAYWSRIELVPGVFDMRELDWQIAAAEQAGKQIILCVGPLKTFSYPEFFVPAHHLRQPFPERTRIKPSAYQPLLTAATAFITRLVERYKDRHGIVAWQLEHEAVDPLGTEHSWRLDAAFVAKEMEVLRQVDPTRPVMLNGFLPTSLPVRFFQWLRTRDQGDSLAVAQRLADIVGIDYYSRHGLLNVGKRTLYLDGSKSPWQQGRRKRLLAQTYTYGQTVMIAEGQAEPWETVTISPNPEKQGMYSCLPEQLIINYNTCMRWSQDATPLSAYLFWGAEYWMQRMQCADSSYLQTFARILEDAQK
jgi:hypothetical protein